MPAQNELRAQQGEGPVAEHPEKRRMSLLQRLASVGLGRREEAAEEADSRRPAGRRRARWHGQRPTAAAAASGPAAAGTARSGSGLGLCRRPRPAHPAHPHQALDPHGRQAPVHNLRGGGSARHPGLPAPAGELRPRQRPAAGSPQATAVAAPSSPNELKFIDNLGQPGNQKGVSPAGSMDRNGHRCRLPSRFATAPRRECGRIMVTVGKKA